MFGALGILITGVVTGTSSIHTAPFPCNKIPNAIAVALLEQRIGILDVDLGDQPECRLPLHRFAEVQDRIVYSQLAMGDLPVLDLTKTSPHPP